MVCHEGLAQHEDDDGVAVARIKGLTTQVGWFRDGPDRRYHPPLPEPMMTWRPVRSWRPYVVHRQGWSV